MTDRHQVIHRGEAELRTTCDKNMNDYEHQRENIVFADRICNKSSKYPEQNCLHLKKLYNELWECCTKAKFSKKVFFAE